jgi:hypothetical protein
VQPESPAPVADTTPGDDTEIYPPGFVDQSDGTTTQTTSTDSTSGDGSGKDPYPVLPAKPAPTVDLATQTSLAMLLLPLKESPGLANPVSAPNTLPNPTTFTSMDRPVAAGTAPAVSAGEGGYAVPPVQLWQTNPLAAARERDSADLSLDRSLGLALLMDATTPRTSFEPMGRGNLSASLAGRSAADWADGQGVSQVPLAQPQAIGSVPMDSARLGMAVESAGQAAFVRSQSVADTSEQEAAPTSLRLDRPLSSDEVAGEEGTTAPAVEAHITGWRAVDSLPYFLIAFAAPLGWLFTHNIRRGNREEPISVRPTYLGQDDGEQG